MLTFIHPSSNIQTLFFVMPLNFKYIHIAYIWGCWKQMSYSSVFGDLGSKRWQMRCTVNNTSHHHILKDIVLRSLKWADKWYSGILFKLGVTNYFHHLMKSYFSKHQFFPYQGGLVEGVTYKALLMGYLTVGFIDFLTKLSYEFFGHTWQNSWNNIEIPPKFNNGL